MPTVLFLCVANSARSQMAEGLARHMAPPGLYALSAGSKPTSVRPEAVQVLAEMGVILPCCVRSRSPPSTRTPSTW